MTDEDLTGLLNRLRWDRRRDPRRGGREYAQTAQALVRAGKHLLSSGDASRAVPVLRRAVERITSTLMYLDDSSGAIGSELRDLMTLYAQACTAAPPPAKSLATWLVKLQCEGPGWPDIVLSDFAAALAPAGLAEMERQVEQRAEAHRQATLADPQKFVSDFAVRDLREQLAEVSGDVDRYVDVLAEHLTHAGQYQRISEALDAVGRRQEAIAWAQRGLREHPSSPQADALRDLLVNLYLAADNPDAALQVRRAEYQRRPIAAMYTALAHTTTHLGADDPLPWALNILHHRTTAPPNNPTTSPNSSTSCCEPVTTTTPGRSEPPTRIRSAKNNGSACSAGEPSLTRPTPCSPTRT